MEGDDTLSAYHVRNRDLYRYHIDNDVPMEYGPTKYMEGAQKLLDTSLASSYVQACMGVGMEVRGSCNTGTRVFVGIIWFSLCLEGLESLLKQLSPQLGITLFM